MGIEDFGGGRAARADVLVVTTNDVPGHQVTQVIGEVFGLTGRDAGPLGPPLRRFVWFAPLG
ncbi:hypothetical protein [Streptomyces sp. NPDC026589]|uniref:hypothetical protein n=1 Tax=Streptomyces sp. NPDC026589 TaxID=3155609 RepID=UPI0033D30EE1